jgi:hypothetical protein
LLATQLHIVVALMQGAAMKIKRLGFITVTNIKKPLKSGSLSETAKLLSALPSNNH